MKGYNYIYFMIFYTKLGLFLVVFFIGFAAPGVLKRSTRRAVPHKNSFGQLKKVKLVVFLTGLEFFFAIFLPNTQ
jgi:uncharacterized membrane protein